jgi:deoxyribonuclease-4
MSIAGGYYKAVERAQDAGCDCVQIFTKNNAQWRARAISTDEAEGFRNALGSTGITHPLSHASYLINLGSPDAALWKKSTDALVVELQRAATLQVPYVVVHPGSHMDRSEKAGVRRVVRALNEVLKQTRDTASQLLLETTAGQGTNLGWQFEQLAAMLDGVKNPDAIGVCLDTCHMFAAGYALESEKDYRSTMRQLNRQIGISRVRAVHLNDSKRERGSRVDRHEHIGRGHLGVESFRRLLSDRRFRKIPMYLETPKGKLRGRDWDTINLGKLRKLAVKRP